MRLSHLLKTIGPVKFYGKKHSPGGSVQDFRNAEHHDPEANGVSCSPNPDISSIHYSAQDVRPGGLFVAIPGLVADGHDFIDEALERGASAIVTQRPVKSGALIVEVENTRKALAAISAQFYSNPSEKLVLIGITGTNGKTTTAFLIEHIFLAAGIHVGVIGTLNYRYAGKTFKNPITTPESLDLQKILAEMLEYGISHVVMEVSSHALDLYRVHQCKFSLAIFTNLTQDHLDYHGTMAAYGEAKIMERHRHRYEFNNRYLERLRAAGMAFSGTSVDGLVEIIELPSHPWFVACQFHPEFKSQPMKPHPLFREFIRAACKQAG